MSRYATPDGGRAARLTAVEPAATAAPALAPVVVGVDGSDLSLVAVRLAAREAALHRRQLRIVHSFNWVPDPDVPIPVSELRAAAERLMERAVATAATAAPTVPVTSAILEGPAVTTLLRESAAAGLLAIGDGGLGACSCIPVDTPALQIAARSGCSVLVAPQTIPEAGPVVVGVDGSTSSHGALDFALDAAARRQTRVVVVRAWDPLVSPEGTEVGIAAQLAEAIAAAQRSHPGAEAEARVRVGDPKDILMEECAGAELVVASARGEQPWRGMLGAVSQALLYHCTAPVVIVRGAHELYVQV